MIFPKRLANNHLRCLRKLRTPGSLSLPPQKLFLHCLSARVKFGRELQSNGHLFTSPIAPSKAFINPLRRLTHDLHTKFFQIRTLYGTPLNLMFYTSGSWRGDFMKRSCWKKQYWDFFPSLLLINITPFFHLSPQVMFVISLTRQHSITCSVFRSGAFLSNPALGLSQRNLVIFSIIH
jgi:hypothetical protein